MSKQAKRAQRRAHSNSSQGYDVIQHIKSVGIKQLAYSQVLMQRSQGKVTPHHRGRSQFNVHGEALQQRTVRCTLRSSPAAGAHDQPKLQTAPTPTATTSLPAPPAIAELLQKDGFSHSHHPHNATTLALAWGKESNEHHQLTTLAESSPQIPCLTPQCLYNIPAHQSFFTSAGTVQHAADQPLQQKEPPHGGGRRAAQQCLLLLLLWLLLWWRLPLLRRLLLLL
jgi:hypothetical protein